MKPEKVFFFLGPLRTIHQLFPEQKTKCVSVLVCKLQAYNKTQVQKLHLTLAEPMVFLCDANAQMANSSERGCICDISQLSRVRFVMTLLRVHKYFVA